MTPTQIEHALKLVKTQLYCASEIAALVGVSKYTIKELLWKHKLTAPDGRIPLSEKVKRRQARAKLSLA